MVPLKATRGLFQSSVAETHIRWLACVRLYYIGCVIYVGGGIFDVQVGSSVLLSPHDAIASMEGA